MATAANIIRFLEGLPPELEVTMAVWDDENPQKYGQPGGYKQVRINSFHIDSRAQQDEQGRITGPAITEAASLSPSYY